MRRMEKSVKFFLVICALFSAYFANAQEVKPCLAGGQTSYFGVEMNGVLCGYSVETSCYGSFNGRKVRYEYSEVVLKMSVLNASVDGGFRWKYVIDSATNKIVEIQVDVINGTSVVTMMTRISGDTAWFSSPSTLSKKGIPIKPEVIFATQTWYTHLYYDFVKMKAKEKGYEVYDPVRGEITKKEYVRKSEENIVLNDSAFQTLVLEEKDCATGIKTSLWLNRADGFNVKAVVDGKRNIYYADKSVTGRITFANIDNELFTRVDKNVPDIINLSWMKVRAKINSYGEEISVDKLNLPGQKFEGNVTGSLVDGIFEIAPVRYTGKNAPAFPPDFTKSTDLIKYLKPEVTIESDDPLIISEAVRITAGSKDSWEAAVRLSKWVAENIAGAIPGGISAINTLKTREAECGGHSRLLAAFCRAVGIPAKLSVGCMYTHYNSGGFGQHAWTEVFMGDAGWIPVDATINEPHFIDAGHIKLGENASFRPVSMEILDFRTGTGTSGKVLPADLRLMLGSYMNVEKYRMFSIIERNGGIAIDIPGRMVLDLNLPDNEGKWYPKLTREISLTPGNIDNGQAGKIVMHQYFRLKKISSPDSALNGIPEELTKYAGNYQFAPARLSLDVRFDNGVLNTAEPLGRSKERITYLKKDDAWVDKSGSYEIRFLNGSENDNTLMMFTVRLEFLRGEPVSNRVEAVSRESGIDAGLRIYDEIKKSGDKHYFFSEQMLHQVAHNLLKQERLDDAIKVFEKNVQEYPGSFLANDALAEAYLKKGDNAQAVKYFKIAVKLNPDYDYGKKMIEELKYQ